MQKRSLGLIETWGFTPAVEAADAGTKAANVTMPGLEVVPVGRVVVRFLGDVAAVATAVRAGAAAAERVGKVIGMHVIARPHPQLIPLPLPSPSEAPSLEAEPESGGEFAAEEPEKKHPAEGAPAEGIEGSGPEGREAKQEAPEDPLPGKRVRKRTSGERRREKGSE